MENLITRYRNTTVLVVVLFAQVLGLAMQVKRPGESGTTRLWRVWVVNTVTPIEKAMVASGRAARGVWTNYVYLRGVRRENRELRDQIEQMRLEQVRLSEDAGQARRLQTLLGFKEQFISATVAAQVIGTSGSDLSRIIYIDKGANDGIKSDMAVISANGIVGKVLRVYSGSSQVLEVNDPSSGVGAVLEKSRLQGILQGTASGELLMRYVMSDEKVAPGEVVLTSGGDRIFPKGLPIGTVIQSTPGSDLFLNIRVKPAANLSRVEEVLVVTRIVDKAPELAEPAGPQRAADILAQRLPSVPPKPAAGDAKVTPGQGGAAQPAGTKPEKPATVASAKPSPNGATSNARSAESAATSKPAATTTPTSPKPKVITDTAASSLATTKPSATAAANGAPKPATAPAGVAGVKPATTANTKTAPSATASEKPANPVGTPASSTPAMPASTNSGVTKPVNKSPATTNGDKASTAAAPSHHKPVDTTPAKPNGDAQTSSPVPAGDEDLR